MKRTSHMAVVTIMSLILGVTSTEGYEDNTHQRLSQRAIQVAANNAGAQGVPPNLVSLFVYSDGTMNTLGLQVISGAGAPESEGDKAGEDYTTYDINWQCPVEVTPKHSSSEPLNHFGTGLLWGGPACVKFQQFMDHAVKLWKLDKKPQAAFILGRALHLVEDMAQPQHALDEAHYPYTTWHWIPVGGFYNPSFLEFFTEAHITDQNGYPTTLQQDFCPENGGYPDYTGLIGGVDAYGCEFCSQPLDYFFDSAHRSEALRAPAGKQFTISDLKSWFPGQQFDAVASSYSLPFQLVGKPCDTKNYRSSRDFRWNDFVSASINSIDLGYRLKEAQSGAAGFASWHANALLKPAVADAAGVIAAFWNEVKDVNPNQKPCSPPSPAGDTPDDSAQVKSSVVTAASAMPSSADWHNICRVGISKGLPTMADYGVSSSLFDQIAALVLRHTKPAPALIGTGREMKNV